MGRPCFSLCLISLSLLLLTHCYSSKLKGYHHDAQGDEDRDSTSDVPSDTANEDLLQDTVSDDGPDDEPVPQHCSGSDTLTLRYVDPEGNPVPDLAVALACLDDRYEGVTNGDGRISFDGLDLAGFPVAVTCASETFAYTLTDIGGPRPVSEILQIPLHVMTCSEGGWGVELQGSIVRTQPGSWVIVSSALHSEMFNGDTYHLLPTPVGTDLPLSAMELTIEGSVATPLAAAFLRYDSPPEGENGPQIVLEPAVFDRAQILVNYDVGDESPLNEPDWEDFSRAGEGAYLRAFESDDITWLAGFATSWIRGGTQDTMEIAWTQDLLAEAIRSTAHVEIFSSSLTSGPWYMANAELRGDPSTWTAVTIHDPPDLADRESLETVPFDEELLVNIPARVDLVVYMVYSFGLDSTNCWFIQTPRERSTIRFSSFPWPTQVPQRPFLSPDPSHLPEVMIGGAAYDADPFEQYVLWNDLAWSWDHFVSSAVAQFIEVELPKD